ncbi:spore germination protein (amino acid permease) [Natribacillus halophilus]|uniref:Spore germination protein (Amino acid permease) n=2 Tax=Natribacillus halophilus TaxID=549003 RepID=A0A1G8RM24_9BACI|nr:spore germination protein (amino acid permease) [Natribacillus halophilus]
MRLQPPVTRQVSPFFAFFIVTTTQIGVGIFSFQLSLISFAGHDGWIAVILSALLIHVVIWLIYKLLPTHHTIVDIHQKVFGKWIGAFVSLYFLFYYSLFALVTLVVYTQILRVWLFPEISPWVFFLVLGALVYVFTMGGLRKILGASVLAVFITVTFLAFPHLPYGQMQLGSLFPIGDHAPMDLWLATKEMTFQYLGFEILLMAYPFLKDAPRSHKWAQYGVTFSMITYLVSFILPILYFHEHHLATILWPTLTLWNMEYFGMAAWSFVVLPNMALWLWAASRVAKQSINISQKHTVRGLSLLIFGSAFFFTTYRAIEDVLSFASGLGFYTFFVYLPILYILRMIIVKRRDRS